MLAEQTRRRAHSGRSRAEAFRAALCIVVVQIVRAVATLIATVSVHIRFALALIVVAGNYTALIAVVAQCARVHVECDTVGGCAAGSVTSIAI